MYTTWIYIQLDQCSQTKHTSTSCKSKLKNLPRLHGACFKHENSFAKIMFNKGESVSEMQNKNKLTKLDIWIKLYKL